MHVALAAAATSAVGIALRPASTPALGHGDDATD